MRTSVSRGRIHLMDEIRGFAVFCMVFYHAFYSIAFLFAVEWMKSVFYFFLPAEPFFAVAFVGISGISSQLSHSNLLRGGRLLAIALAVTLVTWLVVPEETIRFGVLHLLSVCMLLFGLLQKPLARVPRGWGLALCLLGFLLTAGLAFGNRPYLGIPFVPAAQLSALGDGYGWLFPLGFRTPSFTSGDYFPLFPWCFVFFFGTFLGRYAREGRFPAWTYRSRIPFFSWIGRHALIIYVVHQPVIYGLMMLLEWITK